MRFRVGLFGLVVVLAMCTIVAAHASKRAPRVGLPRHARFTDGAGSVDELLQRFITALAAKDRDALEALRITEDEYRTIVLPGSVDKGQTPPRYPEEYFQYFWGVMNGKSIYSRANLMETYGGFPLTLKDHRFRKGVKDYAWYRAYQQSDLTIANAQGDEDHLLIGSIAEFKGRFKFISYIRD